MNFSCVFFLAVLTLTTLHQSLACCNSCSCSSSCYSRCCVDVCREDCCKKKDCNTTKGTTSTTEAETTTEPVTTTRSPPTPTPVRSIRSSQKPSIKIGVSSFNFLNNDNHINIDSRVNTNVVNNISNKGYGGSARSSTTTSRTTWTPRTTTEGTTTTQSTTTTAKTTIAETTTNTITGPTKSPTCCIVIVPCVTYNCNPYHYRCHGCQGTYGYLPIDPCYGGCQKKPSWTRETCTMGQCFTRNINCSYCHYNFYQTYEEYSRCYGCFYSY
ncbi:unnamed protein product [Tenebrio molitor]|nr:unnamed protein product [Tenebrio molitor]